MGVPTKSKSRKDKKEKSGDRAQDGSMGQTRSPGGETKLNKDEREKSVISVPEMKKYLAQLMEKKSSPDLSKKVEEIKGVMDQSISNLDLVKTAEKIKGVMEQSIRNLVLEHEISECESKVEEQVRKLNELRETIKTKKADDKVVLLYKIGKAYLSVDRPEEAAAAAEQGIELLKSKTTIQNGFDGTLRMRLHCIAAKAHKYLLNLKDSMFHIVTGIELSRNQCRGNAGPKSDAMEKLKNDLESMKMQLLRTSAAKRKFEVIGQGGGQISARDVDISFKPNSLERMTLIQVSTEPPMPRDMDDQNMLQVSPTLQLTPHMNLGVEADVTLTVWITKTGNIKPLPTSQDVQVCYRKTEKSPWNSIPVSPLVNDGKARFRIKDFCHYALFLKYGNAAAYQYDVRSYLFIDIWNKTFASRIIENCQTCFDYMLKTLKITNYKLVCESECIYKAEIGDKIITSLEQIAYNDQEDRNLQPREATVTLDFLKSKIQENQEYHLDEEATGFVKFKHITKHMRGVIEEAATEHEHRYNLGNESQQVMNINNAFLGKQEIQINQ